VTTQYSSEDANRRGFTPTRAAILVVLFFLSIPGWVVGGYLILKWSGLIRGMSRENELAAGWAVTAFAVTILAAALAVVLTLPAGQSAAAAGSATGPILLVLPTLAAVGAFYLVKTHGVPQIIRNPDWKGFWIGVAVAVVGFGVSISSYESAASGGGRYVILWGAVLVGGLMALRSLRRPYPKAGVGGNRSDKRHTLPAPTTEIAGASAPVQVAPPGQPHAISVDAPTVAGIIGLAVSAFIISFVVGAAA
jgi:hypothetical protein